MTLRNSSAVTRSSGAKTETIASFTQTSIGPSSRSTNVAARSIAAASLTSTGSAKAWPPSASTSVTAASRPSCPRASMATDAPSVAKALTAARPTPADAPVMTTTR